MTTTIDTYELLHLRLIAEGIWVRGEEEVTALTDEQLVRRAYALVLHVDEPLSDQLYRVLDEVFERFAPEAAWAHEVWHQHEAQLDAETAERELEGTREAFERRAALRAKVERDA